MRTIVHILLILTLWGSAKSKEDRYHDLTLQGIEYAYNLDVDKATLIFDKIIKFDPNNPHGYVLQSVNYFYRLQFEDSGEEYEKRFKKYAAQAVKLSKKLLANQAKKLDALFYLGTIHMYLAAYHVSQNNWIRAYWYGKDGIAYLQKVVGINPNYYDAYLGLGLYHYYADVMPKFVKTVSVILGIEGDRKRGLRELQIAGEKGKYSRAEALFFLGNIYLFTENEYELALACSRKLTRLYPKGFLLFHGEALQKNGHHAEAAAVFNRAILENNSSRFPFFTIWSRFLLGNIYFEMNQFPDAIEQFQQASALAAKSSDKIKWVLAWSNFKIAECYDMMQQPKRAGSFYRKVKKSEHKRAHKQAQERLKKPLLKAELDLTFGHNYFKQKDFDRAIEIYQAVLTKAARDLPDYPARKIPEIQHHIGKALFEKKEVSDAVFILSKVITTQKVQEKWVKPWCHYYLGKCYSASGEIRKAKEHFKLASKFNDNRLRFVIEKARDALASNVMKN